MLLIIKRITLLAVITFTSMVIQGQEKIDVVHLKNGSIIKGEIIEIVPNKHIKIKTFDGSEWVFEQSKILKTTKEKSSGNFQIVKSKNKGFYNITEIGLVTGENDYDNDNSSFIFSTICGYQWNPKFQTGIGIGLEYYERTVAPIFLDIRYNFKNKQLSPFVYFQGGWIHSFADENNHGSYYYGNNEKNKYQSGYMINPGVGIKYRFTSGSALIFSVGYRHQQFHLERYNKYTEETIDRFETYNRFSVKVGFVFN